MELPWKTVTGIINRRLTADIKFHNTLHNFHTGRGMGTTPPEANLLQNLTEMREEVLYKIFLDLHKDYYALYCDCCLKMLVAYDLSSQELLIL